MVTLQPLVGVQTPSLSLCLAPSKVLSSKEGEGWVSHRNREDVTPMVAKPPPGEATAVGGRSPQPAPPAPGGMTHRTAECAPPLKSPVGRFRAYARPSK